MKVSKFAMDDLVKLEDLKQYFLGTVVLYKGKPVLVKAINVEKIFKMLDLFTQKTIIDDDAVKHITPPMRRLGMINICGSVVYCERRPARIYQMGINKNNLRFHELLVPYPEGANITLQKAKLTDSVEFAEMLFGKYPTFLECIEMVEKFGGAAAFDKQFAIDNGRGIWYKTKNVGHLLKGGKSVDNIKWDSGYEHLILLLKGNYEKDSRTVWKTAPQR